MKKIILLLFVIILSATISETSSATETQWQTIKLEHQSSRSETLGEEIWGQVEVFRTHSITLESGQKYDFSKNVLIALENLAQNKKGNVRIVLDLNGEADFVFFHGIDMPEVFRRFGR